MSDRELLEFELELAAKAAGFEFAGKLIPEAQGKRKGPFILLKSRWTQWNPVTNDGDALRLAVKLRIMLNHEINCGCDIVEAIGPEDENMSRHCSTESIEGDPYAATRRAIVRAAAEIGRQMQKSGAA